MATQVLIYTEEQRNEILKLFDTNADEVSKQVNRLREWMEAQPYFSEVPSNLVIEKFLAKQKFNIEKTKKSLTGYYICRTVLPQFFHRNPNSPEMIQMTESFYYTVLPKLTSDYSRVLVFTMKDNCDVDKFDPVLFFANAVHYLEVRAREDYCHKEIHIYDFKNVKFGHIAKFTPGLLKQMHFVLDKIKDSGIIAINFLNVPTYVGSFINVIKSFLQPKLQQRMLVHADFESLGKVINKDNLPKDYGGNAESLVELEEMWKQKFLEYNEIFEQLKNVHIRKDLLPENMKFDDQFGVHGNFRKLDLD